jgi:hypothetical protein
MALDLNTALNSYGFVGTLANAIPELKTILGQAVQAEWQPEQFTRAVQDSQWWKTNAESVRQLVTLEATDPATYHQNLSNAASKVRLMSGQMGRTGDIGNVALRALTENWDDEQIRSAIGQLETAAAPDGNGAYGGDAGQLQNHLKQLAANYGVPATDDYITQTINSIQSGFGTLDGYENLIKARAKATYTHLASQIDAGMTVRDIADPFIATYAQTLEVPETSVNLSDPAIQKALQQRNPDGTATTQPMWQFQRALKDDPRYDKTSGARTEAYSTINRLGKDMGFLS